MTQNQINYQKLEEERYHNRNVEAETRRTNMANEEIKQQTNAINQMHYMVSDAETQRSNRAREAETVRHDVATEAETSTHNRATEAIDWFKASSQDKLNKSNIQLNETIGDNYLADTQKKGAETALTLLKQRSETLGQTQTIFQTNKIAAETELTKQKKETEHWNTSLMYGQAGLTALDVQYYQSRELRSVLQWAGNQNTQLQGYAIGGATRLWTAILQQK